MRRRSRTMGLGQAKSRLKVPSLEGKPGSDLCGGCCGLKMKALDAKDASTSWAVSENVTGRNWVGLAIFTFSKREANNTRLTEN